MKKEQKLYLGVEGGATKSMAILADENGILGKRVGRMANYHTIGEQETKKNLSHLLKPLFGKMRGGKLYAVFGLAGLDTKKDEIVYRRSIKAILPKDAVFRAVNDAHIALEAQCPDEENRILVIAGTGSSVYGESGERSAKAIGWDFILGDEGSGYEVGLKVLKAAAQSWDGRIKKSALQGLVLQKAGSKSMEHFIPNSYKILREQKQDAKSFIASFAPLIDKALARQDQAALEIREQTRNNLAIGTRTVANKLHLKEKEFCLGTAGSLWKMPGLQKGFRKEIKRRFSQVCFSENTDEGAWGAILLAKKLNRIA